MVDSIERMHRDWQAPISDEQVVIRQMEHKDVEAVADLERRCYPVPWSANAYTTEVNNPAAYYAVAVTDSGLIVGYAGMWVVMDEGHITTVAVDPTMRGRKIGERLLIELLTGGVWRGAKRATLEVRERNTVAHNLYKKYGFTDVGMRRHYYSDNGEHAIIMWADGLNTAIYQKMLRDRLRALAS
jgi:ribosomal-protein-alanine N-acetyltransferase